MAGPKKPKHRSLTRKLGSLATMLMSLALIALIAMLYGKSVFEAKGPLKANLIYEVARGTTAPEIARDLKRHGIISDENIFVAAAYLTRNNRRMKAGEYLFPKEASMAEVMSLIVSGKELVYKVTVPEGWTTAQVIERVTAHENLNGEISSVPPEGALLPETYVFRRGMTRDALLQQMRTAQQKLFAEMWEKRNPDLPFKTMEEALVLASIVEKETAIASERPQVAAVFINRLRAGIRLQSDPTIIYGITHGRTKLDRPIRKSDIEADTPYNTYRISGLPPTPIANPGKESIAAVLNPLETRYLYFVADGSGGHVFAETLAEHRKNVRKWRVVEKTLAVEAEADVAPADSPASKPGDPLAEPPANTDAAPAETEDFAIESSKSQASTEKPSAVPVKTVAADQDLPSTPETAPRLTPGSVVEVAGKLVPIPTPRPPNRP